MKKFLGIVCLLMAAAAGAATSGQIPLPPEAQAFPRPIRIITVNCNSGERVQPAIDANLGPVEIDITGICLESVVIRDKDVMLKGTTKPSLDGIRSADRTMPALTIRGSGIDSVDSLSFNNNPGVGMSIQGASVTLSNCLFQTNGSNGLKVFGSALVTATGLTFAGNTAASVNVNDGQFFCTGCDLSGNSFAVQATRGAVASLLDSMVTGKRGLLAGDGGTIADVDCVNGGTTHPCGVQVTTVAASAVAGGLASLFGVGDFTGRLDAEDGGTVSLFGARQLSATASNTAEFFGRIEVGALFDVTPPSQSRLLSTDSAHFGRVLVTDDTVLNGAIRCSSAGDASLDPTIIALPGSVVTGCDHSKLP